MSTLKNKIGPWALGLVVACLFALSVVCALGQCSKPVGSPVTKQVDTVLLVRHDTLVHIDSVLKYKIKRIEVAPDTEIVKQFDTVFADTGHSDTVKTTVYAERECLKCVDSLQACKQMRKVDSVSIDTLGKLARKVDTVKPPITQRLKDVGIGALIGIGLRSLLVYAWIIE